MTALTPNTPRWQAAVRRLCFPLDFPDMDAAADFMNTHDLGRCVGTVKVGPELYVAAGPRCFEIGRSMGVDVFLDLKFHDIPRTVARAVRVGADMGVKYMTVHVQQRETLNEIARVMESYPETHVLGVTVLTSMELRDLRELALGPMWAHDAEEPMAVPARVSRLVRFGLEHGLTGFVCSPQEVRALRNMGYGDPVTPFFVTPGIRQPEAESDDQQRVGTPKQAILDGSNMLVVGRPISEAKRPYDAAHMILEQIDQALNPALLSYGLTTIWRLSA